MAGFLYTPKLIEKQQTALVATGRLIAQGWLEAGAKLQADYGLDTVPDTDTVKDAVADLGLAWGDLDEETLRDIWAAVKHGYRGQRRRRVAT